MLPKISSTKTPNFGCAKLTKFCAFYCQTLEMQNTNKILWKNAKWWYGQNVLMIWWYKLPTIVIIMPNTTKRVGDYLLKYERCFFIDLLNSILVFTLL